VTSRVSKLVLESWQFKIINNNPALQNVPLKCSANVNAFAEIFNIFGKR
jgi:hypothetical protein